MSHSILDSRGSLWKKVALPQLALFIAFLLTRVSYPEELSFFVGLVRQGVWWPMLSLALLAISVLWHIGQGRNLVVAVATRKFQHYKASVIDTAVSQLVSELRRAKFFIYAAVSLSVTLAGGLVLFTPKALIIAEGFLAVMFFVMTIAWILIAAVARGTDCREVSVWTEILRQAPESVGQLKIWATAVESGNVDTKESRRHLARYLEWMKEHRSTTMEAFDNQFPELLAVWNKFQTEARSASNN